MKKFPKWFYLAILVNVLSWLISWSHLNPYSHFTFLFLIGSFIFILDGINYFINGNSLFSRNKIEFWFIWIISSIFWWYFEAVVFITKNWYYLSSLHIANYITVPLATIYFTTVIVGVWEFYEILDKKISLDNIKTFYLPKYSPVFIFVLGLLSILLTILWPQYFFPLIWLSLFFILDPINHWLGYDSLVSDLLNRKSDRLLKLAISSLFFFIFWEMWNYGNDPKWVYEVPFVGNLKIFEMPILGYLGYLPFGWEIFAFYSLIKGLLKFPGYSIGQRNNYMVNPNWKKPYFIMVLCIFLGMSVLFIIGIIINNPKILSKINVLSKSHKSEMKTLEGKLYTCKYSFVSGICLEAEGQRYWLIKNDDEQIKFESSNTYIIEGKIIKRDFGMKELEITGIDIKE